MMLTESTILLLYFTFSLTFGLYVHILHKKWREKINISVSNVYVYSLIAMGLIFSFVFTLFKYL